MQQQWKRQGPDQKEGELVMCRELSLLPLGGAGGDCSLDQSAAPFPNFVVCHSSILVSRS